MTLGAEDKITKRPVVIENTLYFLGRIHIHEIDLTNMNTNFIEQRGEDYAEII